RYVGTPVISEGFAHLCPECAIGADAPGSVGAHPALERNLCEGRREISEHAMLLLIGLAVNDIKTLLQAGQDFGHFFRWILQVVIHCDSNVELGCPDAAKQGIVLTKIAH